MGTKDNTALQDEIQMHLNYLVHHLGARPVGSSENSHASAYLTEYSKTRGWHVYTHMTSTIIRKPVQWGCMLHVDDSVKPLSILPGIATLNAHYSNIQVTPYIYAKKEDFVEHPPLPGTLVLVELGALHEADACRLAHPAAAVGWFRKGQQTLYSGNCMRQEEPLVPGFALFSEDVHNLLLPHASVTLNIEVMDQVTTLRNIVVDVGHVTHHPCFITHYDSRPFSPGANDNASGVACLLGLLSLWSADKPARFIFFDGEEVGARGSQAYVETLQSEQRLREIRCVINPDSVGLDKLHLYTADRFGPLSEELLVHARHVFSAHGWMVPERAARSGVSDYMHFRTAGVPCLFLSDFPNDVRHTTGDTMATLDIPVLTRLTTILAHETFYHALTSRS